MRHELQLVLMFAKELPAGELPRLLGELEEIRATAMARLTAPAMAQLQQHDELLDTAEAAHRLGISKDFLLPQSPRLFVHPPSGAASAVLQRGNREVY
jgi:hypothetical protein